MFDIKMKEIKHENKFSRMVNKKYGLKIITGGIRHIVR